MFGILWRKSGEPDTLRMAGLPYEDLNLYLEDAYLHSWHHVNGWISEIVPVRLVNGKYEPK